MRHRLLAVAAALSASLLAATCFLWIRSHLVRDYAWVRFASSEQSPDPKVVLIYADSGGGQIEFSRGVWTAAHWRQIQGRNELANLGFFHRTFPDVPTSYARSAPPTFWNHLGFRYNRGPTHVSIWVPYWFVALLSALLPAAEARRWLRRRRLKPGQCSVCGYDLRATPGRCPECGAESDQRAVLTKS